MVSHDASASALGYIFQLKWALLELVRSLPDRPDQYLTLESLDDVGWVQDDGVVEELIQLKHHQVGAGDLTDMSPDIWRTLKVWMDSPSFLEVSGPLLTLVTTALAPLDSAAHYLTFAERNVDMARLRLDDAAQSSSSKATRDSRLQWLGLTEEIRDGLVARVRVIDSAPSIEDVDSLVTRALGVAPPIAHLGTYLDLIWAWWFRVCVDLLAKRRPSVTGLQLHQVASDIRDQITPANLPTTVGSPNMDSAELMKIHGSKVFVNQLSWLNLRDRQVEKAVLEYHRAITQTTEWIDGKLLEMREFETFKEALIDEWENSFDDMLNSLPTESSEQQRRDAGRLLYQKLRDSATVQVRPNYSDSFYARGTRCEIADGRSHGWHPDFETLLKTISEVGL